jgi:hypothetical protein
MRVLSIQQAVDALETADLFSFFGGVDWQYPDPLPSYFLPKDSGPKVGLGRVLANTFLDRGPAILWMTETGIFSSAEHRDLFMKYRLSYGEGRSVEEAPVHTFEENDRDAFISILCLGLFFYWGFEIMSRDRSLAVTVSHDEWLEYRFAPGHESIVPYFDKWLGEIFFNATQRTHR